MPWREPPKAFAELACVGLLVLSERVLLLHDRQRRVDHVLRVRVHVGLEIGARDLPRLHAGGRLAERAEIAGGRRVELVRADVAAVRRDVPRLLHLRRDVGNHLPLILLERLHARRSGRRRSSADPPASSTAGI